MIYLEFTHNFIESDQYQVLYIYFFLLIASFIEIFCYARYYINMSYLHNKQIINSFLVININIKTILCQEKVVFEFVLLSATLFEVAAV